MHKARRSTRVTAQHGTTHNRSHEPKAPNASDSDPTSAASQDPLVPPLPPHEPMAWKRGLGSRVISKSEEGTATQGWNMKTHDRRGRVEIGKQRGIPTPLYYDDTQSWRYETPNPRRSPRSHMEGVLGQPNREDSECAARFTHYCRGCDPLRTRLVVKRKFRARGHTPDERRSTIIARRRSNPGPGTPRLFSACSAALMTGPRTTYADGRADRCVCQSLRVCALVCVPGVWASASRPFLG